MTGQPNVSSWPIVCIQHPNRKPHFAISQNNQTPINNEGVCCPQYGALAAAEMKSRLSGSFPLYRLSADKERPIRLAVAIALDKAGKNRHYIG